MSHKPPSPPGQEECINKDYEKVNKKWNKKLESTKSAFEKDKTEYGPKNPIKSTQNR